MDQMSIVDPSITLASKLGNLSVKELEPKSVQEELKEDKHDILDKEKLLPESSKEKDNLKRQVEVVRQGLKDAKFLLWDNITKDVKKLKDHLIMLQDERSLVITCLSNVIQIRINKVI